MKYEDFKYVLSNGGTFGGGANGAIGLGTDDELTVGYDYGLYIDGADEFDAQSDPTVRDKIEIAEFMIARWSAYKDALQ